MKRKMSFAAVGVLGALVLSVLPGVPLPYAAYAQSSPSVALSLSSASVEEGAAIAVTMSFGGLEPDADGGTTDYIFRADVVGADGCEDRAGGYGLGVDRYINRVDEDPETRTGTISADCPAGDHTVEAGISSPDGVELASATASFTVTAPAPEPTPDPDPEPEPTPDPESTPAPALEGAGWTGMLLPAPDPDPEPAPDPEPEPAPRGEEAPAPSGSSPLVAIALFPSASVQEGTAMAVTMGFGGLEPDADGGTTDYIFRADVVGADGCEDRAGGYGLGVDRYINRVDEDPETRTGTISADCPAGNYTLEAGISSPDGVELASASAAFTVTALTTTAAPPVEGEDDPPPSAQQNAVPTVSIARVGAQAMTEGNDRQFTVSVPVAVTADLAVTVTVQQPEGADVFGATPPTSVTIPASGTSATLTVEIDSDGVWEPHADVTVTLVEGADYDVSATGGSATVTVNDNDIPDLTPAWGPIPGTVLETVGEITFSIIATTHRDEQPHGEFSLTARTDSASAISPDDFDFYANNHLFYSNNFRRTEVEPGMWRYIAVKQFSVAIVDDRLAEGDEHFRVLLEGAPGLSSAVKIRAGFGIPLRVNLRDDPCDAYLGTTPKGLLRPCIASAVYDADQGAVVLTWLPGRDIDNYDADLTGFRIERYAPRLMDDPSAHLEGNDRPTVAADARTWTDTSPPLTWMMAYRVFARYADDTEWVSLTRFAEAAPDSGMGPVRRVNAHLEQDLDLGSKSGTTLYVDWENNTCTGSSMYQVAQRDPDTGDWAVISGGSDLPNTQKSLTYKYDKQYPPLVPVRVICGAADDVGNPGPGQLIQDHVAVPHNPSETPELPSPSMPGRSMVASLSPRPDGEAGDRLTINWVDFECTTKYHVTIFPAPDSAWSVAPAGGDLALTVSEYTHDFDTEHSRLYSNLRVRVVCADSAAMSLSPGDDDIIGYDRAARYRQASSGPAP